MNTQQKIWELCLKRGVIPDIGITALNHLFIDALQEEVNELTMNLFEKGYFTREEVADVYIVICNMASANGLDIEDIALEKATKDVTRKP